MYGANKRHGGMVNECAEMMDRQILISDGRALTLGISNKGRNGGRRQHIYIYIYINRRNCTKDEVTLRSE